MNDSFWAGFEKQAGLMQMGAALGGRVLGAAAAHPMRAATAVGAATMGAGALAGGPHHRVIGALTGPAGGLIARSADKAGVQRTQQQQQPRPM